MRGKHRFEVLLIASCLTTAAHAQLIEDHAETSPLIVADLIDDLRDDDVPGNAAAAVRRLVRIGEAAIAALEQALLSDDRQQRQYAAQAMGQIDEYCISAPAARVLVEGMVSDDVCWNATDAINSLCHGQKCMNREARAELEKALQSPDYQQRQVAASILCNVDDYIPGDRMLEVLVEGLRHDEFPRGPIDADPYEVYTPLWNAADGFRELIDHADRAERYLLQGLHGNDAQQQFLSSVLLVAGGSRAAAPAAIPLLIEHLRDNAIPGDAVMSARALYAYGIDVLPYLAAARPPEDPQQRNLVRMIELSLTDPESIDRTVCREHDMPLVSEAVLNPVTGRTLHRSELFWYGNVFAHVH